MEAVTLVADVGGTQSRLGLAQDGIVDKTTVKYFANARFHSFYEVIAQFLRASPCVQIAHCVIAIAGPVSSNSGSLTNLDWKISRAGLQRATKTTHATIINDLTALGYSLNALPLAGIQQITASNPQTQDVGQYLVVGLGTGFNVCPVIPTGAHPICLQVELGHSSLPYNIKSAVSEVCDTSTFTTIEDIFCGKGLSKLYQLISDSDIKDGALIVKDHQNGTDPAATKTLETLASLLGLLTRELATQYLPTAGIYFAGSVSRGLFGSGVNGIFNKTVVGEKHFLNELSKIPIGLITEDAAGLLGCAQRSLWK